MISPWIFAAFCLFVLFLCAVLRVVSHTTPLDRLTAVITGCTLFCAGAFALAIGWGSLVVIELSIIAAAVCFAATVGVLMHRQGETS